MGSSLSGPPSRPRHSPTSPTPSGFTQPSVSPDEYYDEDQADLIRNVGHQVGQGIGYAVGHAMAEHYGQQAAQEREQVVGELPDRILDAHARRTEHPWRDHIMSIATAGVSTVDQDWRAVNSSPQITQRRTASSLFKALGIDNE